MAGASGACARVEYSQWVMFGGLTAVFASTFPVNWPSFSPIVADDHSGAKAGSLSDKRVETLWCIPSGGAVAQVGLARQLEKLRVFERRVHLAGRRVEITGAVSLNEPLFLRSPGLVHASAALHGGPGFNRLGPTDHMRVRGRVNELRSFINILGH